MDKEIQNIFAIRDSENIERRLGDKLGSAVVNAIHFAQKADKELDILHDLITELYNIDANVPAIKKALAKIKKIK